MQPSGRLSLPRALLSELRFGWPATAALAILAAFAAVSGAPAAWQLLPAAAWAGLSFLFARSLRDERSVIERMAYHVEPTAPAFIGPYCRVVTALHAALFAAIAVRLAYLALAGDAGAFGAFAFGWAWLLLALFEAGEWLVRKLHFRRYGTGPIDRMLSRRFPAEETAAGRRSLAHLRRLAEERAAPQPRG